jgi:hypothetical protein
MRRRRGMCSAGGRDESAGTKRTNKSTRQRDDAQDDDDDDDDETRRQWRRLFSSVVNGCGMLPTRSQTARRLVAATGLALSRYQSKQRARTLAPGSLLFFSRVPARLLTLHSLTSRPRGSRSLTNSSCPPRGPLSASYHSHSFSGSASVCYSFVFAYSQSLL